MSKKIRYLILAAGVLMFCLAAPLMILYVTGITYNFGAGQFQKTGILALNTDPGTVNMFLNGQLLPQTSGSIKFLVPGEYNLTLSKAGYFDWSKRLEVEAGQVIWASPSNNKIFLYLKPALPKILAEQVSDFTLSGSKLFYLTASGLTITSPKTPDSSQNLPLSKSADKLLLSPGGQLALLTQSQASKTPATILLADVNSQKLFDLSSLFKQPAVFKFSANDQLYALESGTLYQVDYRNLLLTPLLPAVSAFSFLDNDLYYLTPKAGGLALDFLARGSKDSTELATGIPAANHAEVLVDYEKEIFLLLDGTLYKAGGPLLPLAGNVGDWQFNPFDSGLIFTSNGELDYYNSFSHTVNFITRSQNSISKPLLQLNLGEAFYFTDKRLSGIELDTRDHQNEYSFGALEQPQKFQLDDQNQNLLVLDGGRLELLKIR